MTGRLGVLGGTFDPVHFGHLDAADAATRALELDGVLFVPSRLPPHRAARPQATSFHRFALVALAVNGRPGYEVSDLELAREGRSYTADTLRALHAAGWDPSQLFFILGADAFADIATWHEFPAVLDAAHFAVVTRPGAPLDAALDRTPELRPRMRRGAPGADAGPPGLFLLEAKTRDVSSTTIRQQLDAGEAIDALVPAPVAQHISAHHLYQTDDKLHGRHHIS